MNDETWKPILSSPGYSASDQGRINRDEDGKVLHQHEQASGHRSVFIRGNRQNLYVHRLVLSAFVRLPETGEVGRHLDDDQSNNRLENLAWGTLSDNARDRVINQKRKREA